MLRFGLACALGFAALASRANSQTICVDVDAHGFQGTLGANWSGDQTIAISRDGRFVVFTSTSTNLAQQGASGSELIVRDRERCMTELVSANSSGAPSSGVNFAPSISDDGRWVAFAATDGNLVQGDTNGVADIFLHDREQFTTICVSVDPAGARANDASSTSSISADGRYVAFASAASNLVPNDTNGVADVFIRDLHNGVTTIASLDSFGAQANGASARPHLSGDGRYLVFDGAATNLVANPVGAGTSNVFWRDLQSGITELVSVSTSGTGGDSLSLEATISDDGQRIAFESFADDLVANDSHGNLDVFLRDRLAGTMELVSANSSGAQGDGDSSRAYLSSDGRFVSFVSTSTNLSFGDFNGAADAFVKKLANGETTRVSNSSDGVQGDADPGNSTCVAAGGSSVVYVSMSANLVLGDTNAALDVFVSNPSFATPGPATYCTAKTNSLGCRPTIGFSGEPSISGFDEFVINAIDVLNQKQGIFFWGASSAAINFEGGTLCVQPPFVRTAVQNSGGTPPPILDCTSGVYAFHFSQSSMASAGITAGATLYGQWWSRDPGFAPPDNVSLSDALRFTIGP